MATSTVYKPVTSTIATEQELSTFMTLNGSGLTYTFCDRTNSTNLTGNYFLSFNLPFEASALASGSTLALSHPELYQLNVDHIIVIPIPAGYYDDHIDGRTITLQVPQLSGATGLSSKTIVSSTYSTLVEESSNTLLGSNVAFLFSDSMNLPYTGYTNNEAISHSANTTWNPIGFFNRPAAVPYSDLLTNDINTDRRPQSAITYALSVPVSYPTNTNQGYNYDLPVGFVALDKGFIILTHPAIVNSIPWTQGQIPTTAAVNVSSGTTGIYFSATSNSNLTYNSVDVEFTTATVCIALPAEFFFTNNPSWPLSYNINQLNANTNNFTPIYVTEVGLYNINNELIARAKLSEPIQKNYTNVLTFNINISV